jgi:hypothetical protein
MSLRESDRPDAADMGMPKSVTCPFCEGTDTELHSPFGGQASVATYWCRRCHTAFDWIKWGQRHSERDDRRDARGG